MEAIIFEKLDIVFDNLDIILKKIDINVEIIGDIIFSTSEEDSCI